MLDFSGFSDDERIVILSAIRFYMITMDLSEPARQICQKIVEQLSYSF